MPNLLKKAVPIWVYWLALLGLAAALVAFGWVKGSTSVRAEWDLAEAKRGAAESRALAEAQSTARKVEREAAAKVAALDKQHFKELQHAKNENSALRRQLANGAVRVRFPAYSPGLRLSGDSLSAVLGDGAAGCDLDPAIADALVGIAGDGDTAIRKLTMLQDYVKGVVLPVRGSSVSPPMEE